MKKLLSVLFAVAFALSVSGFALAADPAVAPKKAAAEDNVVKAEKKAEKKAKKAKKATKKAKKAEKKAEKAPEAAPAPAPAEKK